jgi:phosphoribosylanthranilate isomerase
MKIKVCGLKHSSNITEIAETGIDFVGMIFYKKSVRYVNGSLSFDEARQINSKVKKVGVFVNENPYSVINAIAHYDLDIVQFHGNESEEYCKELKQYAKVIKTFGIDEQFNFERMKEYEGTVDYFLFDTATPYHGGSGKSFDYELLNKYNMDVPFFISGGISLENIQTIKQLNIKQLFGVDINSKFEISPGLKDVNKIKQFIDQLK